MVAQLFALTKNRWVVPLQYVNFTTIKLLNKKKKEKKQIMESYYRCKEWSLSFLLQDEQLLMTQQNPEPVRTSQEVPLSLNKTSEWKSQRCRFCLDIREGLLTVTKAPKSKKNALYEGTPWPCVQAQGSTRDSLFPAQRFRDSTIGMGRTPLPSEAAFVHPEAGWSSPHFKFTRNGIFVCCSEICWWKTPERHKDSLKT